MADPYAAIAQTDPFVQKWLAESLRGFGYVQTTDPAYMLTIIDRGADLLATRGSLTTQSAEARRHAGGRTTENSSARCRSSARSLAKPDARAMDDFSGIFFRNSRMERAMTCPRSAWRIAVTVFLTCAPPLLPLARAQFVDHFNRSSIETDPQGRTGWAFRTGDGTATMTFRQGGDGYASIRVDATTDRRGIWWALIKHKVSENMDLRQLARPEMELRIETRIRVSHAPRRVNLHLNTQRTTDFHSHLMEFDIPDSDTWHTISMTTRDFPAVPGDTVFAQMALIDWGLEKYQVDVDYFKTDIVDVTRAGPDKGSVVPYHPPVPDPKTFRHSAPAAQDTVIDLDNPDVNLNNWYVQDGGVRKRVLTVSGTQYVILRFDLSAWSGRQVADHGLLELTTQSVHKTSDPVKDFGLVRVVEINGGDPVWDQKSVTADSLRRFQPLDRVLNTQMIIDWPVTEGDGGKTYFTISKPVLQRMIDGRTRGIAIKPLGSIGATFYALEHDEGRAAARLLFNVKE